MAERSYAGLPDHTADRLIRLDATVSWRGFTCSNRFHFLAARPVVYSDHQLVADAYESWLTTEIPFEGTPAGVYPYSIASADVFALTVISRLGIPLLSARSTYALNLAKEDPVIPGLGTAVLLRWVVNPSGRGHTGWSYLGPITQRVLGSHGAGQMDPDARSGISLTWGSLPFACTSWLPDTNLRMILLHTEPVPNSDDPEGWWDHILNGFVPDLALRSVSRRLPRVTTQPVPL